jgi:hypothetical protein
MSQSENHWSEVSQIETQLMRHMIALGLDWHNEIAMKKLAVECKAFGPHEARAAYQTKDRTLITKAELFGLVSTMLKTMENAAIEERDVHGGEVWKALGKHLYK